MAVLSTILSEDSSPTRKYPLALFYCSVVSFSAEDVDVGPNVATTEFFVDLTKMPKPETAFFVITGISSVALNKREIFEKIQNIDFLRNLLVLAKNEEANRQLIIIEA